MFLLCFFQSKLKEADIRKQRFPTNLQEIELLMERLDKIVEKKNYCYHENNTQGPNKIMFAEMVVSTIESIKTCAITMQ